MITGKVGKWLGGVLVLCLVIGGLGLSCAPKGPEVEEIVIGLCGPLAFDSGRDMVRGGKMAVDEVNAAGGVLIRGKRVLLRAVEIDTNEYLSVPDAALATEKAITLDKINFLVGSHSSAPVLAMMEVCADYKMVQFTAAGSPNIYYDRVRDQYERYKYLFGCQPMTCAHNLWAMIELHTQLVAAKMKQELGIEKPRVALLLDKVVYTEPAVERVPKVLPEMGMEIVGVWQPALSATDLTSELLAIKEAGAHIIYGATAGAACYPLAKQWVELEIPACVVGNNCCAMTPAFWDAVGGKGNYFCAWGPGTEIPIPITPKTVPFVDKFVAEYGVDPGGFVLMIYDSLNVLVKAIEKAGTIDSDAVVAQLEKIEYTGVAGKYKYDEAHTPIWAKGYITMIGYQWIDGDWYCFWPNEYEGCPEEWNWHYPGTVEYQIPPWVKEYWQGKS